MLNSTFEGRWIAIGASELCRRASCRTWTDFGVTWQIGSGLHLAEGSLAQMRHVGENASYETSIIDN